MQRILIIFFITFYSSYGRTENLTSFKTDYCTNYPEGTRAQPDLWKECCLEHDLYFWAGGDRHDRGIADLNLRDCVAQRAGVDQASIMYYAVRAGSLSPVKFPDKKWNNGWRQRPDHQKLTVEDIDRVEAEILSGYDFIPVSLKDNFIQQLRQRPIK